jgi:hypothetical protein
MGDGPVSLVVVEERNRYRHAAEALPRQTEPHAAMLAGMKLERSRDSSQTL